MATSDSTLSTGRAAQAGALPNPSVKISGNAEVDYHLDIAGAIADLVRAVADGRPRIDQLYPSTIPHAMACIVEHVESARTGVKQRARGAA